MFWKYVIGMLQNKMSSKALKEELSMKKKKH